MIIKYYIGLDVHKNVNLIARIGIEIATNIKPPKKGVQKFGFLGPFHSTFCIPWGIQRESLRENHPLPGILEHFGQ